jgi:hypothetical protein
MPRKQRNPKERFEEISDTELAFLSDKPGTIEGFERFALESDAKSKALWDANKVGILAEWIREHPGSRPELWWLHDAPEPARRRIGGIGDPCHECLNYAEAYTLGLPDHWVSQWDVDYYNGRAIDIHGEPIDPANPPRYESQASFLRRHGLLTPEETRRLRSADFEPEAVLVPVEDEEPTGSIQ